MDAIITKGLNDKFYEKRKSSALDLEKVVRDAHNHNDSAKIRLIIDQLVEMFHTSSGNPLHTRNGGLVGLAGVGIALGPDVAPYMERFIHPLLACFSDPESRVRYFACESMYNIAKVSKGEILVYFNPIFDALSKLAADVETSVKNGAELLDRLLKDIVAESATIHFPQYAETEKVRRQTQDLEPLSSLGILVPPEDDEDEKLLPPIPRQKAFSLAHFIPLLSERIYAISPFTRSYLVSWITVLDSVPDLELVSYLPDFLDGLMKYLSDPTEDVRIATENLMADLLHEVRDIAIMNRRREARRQKELSKAAETKARGLDSEKGGQDNGYPFPVNGTAVQAQRTGASSVHDVQSLANRSLSTYDDQELGAWNPGQDVQVDHSAIIEILISQLDPMHDEVQQSTALRWIVEFLDFAQDVVIPFTPRLIPVILPNLSHHVGAIQSAATATNYGLFSVVEALTVPSEKVTPVAIPRPQSPPTSNTQSQASGVIVSSRAVLPSSPPPESQLTLSLSRGPGAASMSLPPRDTNSTPLPDLSKQFQFDASTPTQNRPQILGVSSSASIAEESERPEKSGIPLPSRVRGRHSVIAENGGHDALPSRPQSPASFKSASTTGGPAIAQTPASMANGVPLPPVGSVANLASLWQNGVAQNSTTQSTAGNTGTGPSQVSQPSVTVEDNADSEESVPDPFDYTQTATELVHQLMSEYVETRIAALKWCLMLHSKVPKKVLTMDGEEGSFGMLLKTLSDVSEEVIKYDLQLLAQISSTSEDGYFRMFMFNLLQLFSTDRRLLEARGSLIVRQLCLTLNTERIFKTFAEILEKEEDLEFASIMVQRLNVILTTSPELSDFRKRLRNMDSKDGQSLFNALYRSWCHNPVAVFSLCLLAQAYEHASNLLPIVADLEITVQLLVQIDKLVQLIESPVFTPLRLQLLEPERNPYLFKCLYGLLMLLPQSSAFISLRNRLNAVSSLGFLHTPARQQTTAPQASTIRGKPLVRDEGIKWSELLSYFRNLQTKHEKARRGETVAAFMGASTSRSPSTTGTGVSAGRPGPRRKVTDGATGTNTTMRGGMLSAKTRVTSGTNLAGLLGPGGSPNQAVSGTVKPKRTLGVNGTTSGKR